VEATVTPINVFQFPSVSFGGCGPQIRWIRFVYLLDNGSGYLLDCVDLADGEICRLPSLVVDDDNPLYQQDQRHSLSYKVAQGTSQDVVFDVHDATPVTGKRSCCQVRGAYGFFAFVQYTPSGLWKLCKSHGRDT